MSYTNQTANYGLPQYTADDKPTYLGDFNKAMLDIDTAIKNNENVAQASETLAQNANNSASEALSTANTASSSATNAGVKADNAYALAESAKADATQASKDATDAKTIANSANQTATSANATATSAQTTATNANNTATSAQTSVNNLSDKFTISQFKQLVQSDFSVDNGSLSSPNMYIASNSDNSIAKIYGRAAVTPNAPGNVTITFSSNFRPSENISIVECGISKSDFRGIDMTISTNGTVTLQFYAPNTSITTINLFPCIYFLENFGDIIVP